MLRTFLKAAFCSLFFSLALAVSSAAQSPAARMDEVVQSYVDAKQFMGSVLVARGEMVLFSKSYGSANLEWNIPTRRLRSFESDR